MMNQSINAAKVGGYAREGGSYFGLQSAMQRTGGDPWFFGGLLIANACNLKLSGGRSLEKAVGNFARPSSGSLVAEFKVRASRRSGTAEFQMSNVVV